VPQARQQESRGENPVMGFSSWERALPSGDALALQQALAGRAGGGARHQGHEYEYVQLVLLLASGASPA
jgi:hypothetical protein